MTLSRHWRAQRMRKQTEKKCQNRTSFQIARSQKKFVREMSPQK